MSKGKVLIVDDNPANLKLIRVLLAEEGFEVQVAGDAEEALKILDHFIPQIILMDVQLPGMDGLELTRLLKADLRRRDIIIIALTAYAMKGDDEKARAAGADGYLSKPIDTRTLPSMIQSYMARQNPG